MSEGSGYNGSLSRGLPAAPLVLMQASYSPHSGSCAGLKCTRCYKYACPKCGLRSNAFVSPCRSCAAATRVQPAFIRRVSKIRAWVWSFLRGADADQDYLESSDVV